MHSTTYDAMFYSREFAATVRLYPIGQATDSALRRDRRIAHRACTDALEAYERGEHIEYSMLHQAMRRCGFAALILRLEEAGRAQERRTAA